MTETCEACGHEEDHYSDFWHQTDEGWYCPECCPGCVDED